MVPVKTILPFTQADGMFEERFKVEAGGCEIKNDCLIWQAVRASVTVTDHMPGLNEFTFAVVYVVLPLVQL